LAQLLRSHAWRHNNRATDTRAHGGTHAPPRQEHIDYLSLQSLLLRQTTLGFYGQVRLFFQHTKRLAD
jgi:hypothetical protein